MKYSKCDFCQYGSRGKCLYPEYFRNPRNLRVEESDLNPCEEAIDRMMEIMKCEIANRGKRVRIDKNISRNDRNNNNNNKNKSKKR